jgi:hypothetical protein
MMDHFEPYKKFFVNRSWSTIGFELRGCVNSMNNEMDAILAPSTRRLDANNAGEVVAPFMMLTRDEATDLMDALLSAGVRPSSGEGNTGHIGAMKAHLEDMRTLVFNKAGMEKPK